MKCVFPDPSRYPHRQLDLSLLILLYLNIHGTRKTLCTHVTSSSNLRDVVRRCAERSVQELQRTIQSAPPSVDAQATIKLNARVKKLEEELATKQVSVLAVFIVVL